MPRIRTIKPEFWTHPVMAKQDDATRLMAIALLNFADDEGYFHAEPNVIRGFARPFDENSTITRRCLDNLSKIGYVSICENENYGLIGYIETFKEHQRIDRPSDSKLKKYYSSNARRTLDDQSTLERKGTGKGKEQGKESMFVVFWDSYHLITNKEKTDKEATIKYWNKLKNSECEKAIEMITPYFNSLNDKKYCKKARTYLADKNFNDENINKSVTTQVTKPYNGFTENPNFIPG
jgi:hypothetical protein